MTDWTKERVVIIGVARQGMALARFLAQRGAQVILNDRRSEAQLETAIEALRDVSVDWALGGHPLSLLDDATLVCPSGGVPLELPLVAEAVQRGIPLSNDSQIFLENAPGPVYGITGSAGKTTTTTLVGRMANAVRKTWVGGNIGAPLIGMLDEMSPNDPAVMELSSFQLDIMTCSPPVAAVLNLTPNHLDRHGTMDAYIRAKANILHFQQINDVAVLSRDDLVTWSLRHKVRGRLVTFGLAPADGTQFATGTDTAPEMDVYVRDEMVMLRRDDKETAIMPISLIALRGEHNLRNVLAACALAAAAGLSPEAMQTGVAEFGGVAHRLELVATIDGVHWYNDSIATAPERAMAGVRAFNEPLVLLAGGRDKDLPWDDFAALICERVDHLVAFGEVGPMLADRVQHAPVADRPDTIDICSGLKLAVQRARQVAQAGDVVLLSPGGTSFDEFRDFAYRGEQFKQWVYEK